MPDDDQNGMNRDDDGLVLGRSAAIAAGIHPLQVVSGLEASLVPGRPGSFGQDGLEVLREGAGNIFLRTVLRLARCGFGGPARPQPVGALR